jgi:hypothetical protein
MKVSPSHTSGDTARGEEAIHRALSGDAAVKRSGLTAYEQRQAAIALARDMTRGERVQKLREEYLRERDGAAAIHDLVTEETRRLRELDALTYVHELSAHKAALGMAPDAAAREKLSNAFADKVAERRKRLDARAPIDKEAYPRLLREATIDVSDRALLDEARDAARRLREEVYRASKEGDDLASKPRPPKKPAPSVSSPLWEPFV